MHWLATTFEKYPEMAVYLAVGLGYFLGRLKFRGFGLGIVTSSLLAGIFIGNLFHVPVSDQAKAMLFLLFLFGIGYSVGPSFFRNLKGEGWRWALLAVMMPIIGLFTAYVVARILKLDLGYSAGMFSGAMTESPAIGTASEAIRGLSLPDDQKQLLIGHIAVADAICYIFGTIGVIWCCSSIGPKLLGIDLVQEARKEEEKLGIKKTKVGISSAWQAIGFRAYKIREDAPIVGKTVAAAEKSITSARLFVERIRRGGEIFSPTGTTVFEAGDTIAILGRTEVLVKVLGPKSSEIADPDLLQIPVASYDIFVTGKEIVGKTLQYVVDNVEEARGVLLRGVTRGGCPLPLGANVIVERGDTLQVTGSESDVEKLAPVIGRKIQPHEDTDLGVMGIAIFIGILAGAAISFPVGRLHLSLGTSVGTLLMGLTVGWGKSVRPWFGRVPEAAILFMKNLGLAAFVAMIGLKAGPVFVDAVKESGPVLLIGGVFVTLIPPLFGILFGHYVLHLDSVQLLGGVAGAQTMIAGAAAVQEKSESSVANLGYSYTAAIGHILITTSGAILISLLA